MHLSGYGISLLVAYLCSQSPVQTDSRDVRAHIRIDTHVSTHVLCVCMQTVVSTELVPGDIIEVADQVVLPCDLALVSGNCVVNESMLTGESVPVVKVAITYSAGRLSLSDGLCTCARWRLACVMLIC